MFVRLSEREKVLIGGYANLTGMKKADIIHKCIIEYLEDELFAMKAEEAFEMFDCTGVCYTHEEEKKRLGLK